MKNKIFEFIRTLIIFTFLIYISFYNHGKQKMRDENIEKMMHTQDSLHSYYKFNHEHHYKNCKFCGDDLEGDN